jgi:hypothetical protein
VSAHARTVIRALAVFDLVVTALLAFPISARGFVELLYRVNGYFGGVSAPPYFDSVHWLFVGLAGILGVVWAFSRIAAPSRLSAGLDAGGRVAVSLLILWFVLLGSAPALLLLFVASEAGGALLQLRIFQEGPQAGSRA